MAVAVHRLLGDKEALRNHEMERLEPPSSSPHTEAFLLLRSRPGCRWPCRTGCTRTPRSAPTPPAIPALWPSEWSTAPGSPRRAAAALTRRWSQPAGRAPTRSGSAGATDATQPVARGARHRRRAVRRRRAAARAAAGASVRRRPAHRATANPARTRQRTVRRTLATPAEAMRAREREQGCSGVRRGGDQRHQPPARRRADARHGLQSAPAGALAAR